MRPAGDLDVLALRSHYTVAELSRFANVTRQSLGRLLRACNVRLIGRGRAVFVPLCEISREDPSPLEEHRSGREGAATRTSALW